MRQALEPALGPRRRTLRRLALPAAFGVLVLAALPGSAAEAAITLAPAAPGLVAAYGMEEAGGTTLSDLSGNGNNGVLSGATWTSAGRFGSALRFNGTNNFVTVPDSASLDLTTGMTQEAWVNPAALGSIFRTVTLKDRPGGLVYDLYATSGGKAAPSGEISIAGDKSVAGTTAIPLNTWTHLATTYDGAFQRLYVNGVQVAQRAQTGSIGTSTGALRIGGNQVWGEYFDGAIDEVRVYNRALVVTEIQADMNASVGNPDLTPPTAPGNLTATGSVTGAQLTWTAATDDVGISRYEVYRSTVSGFTPSAGTRIAQP